MAGKTQFGDEWTIEIDTAHDSGGAHATSTWNELTCVIAPDDDPGLIVAEFPFRGVKVVGSKRSLRRNPELTLEVGSFHGDAAFDRLYEAATDNTNDGTEILHIRATEGDPGVAGNHYYSMDFVVTQIARGTETGDGATFTYTLKPAADSPNTPVLDAVTSGS